MEYKVLKTPIRHNEKVYLEDEIIIMDEKDSEKLVEQKYLEIINKNLDLDSASLKELKTYAKNNNINITSKTREEVLEEIKEWTSKE